MKIISFLLASLIFFSCSQVFAVDKPHFSQVIVNLNSASDTQVNPLSIPLLVLKTATVSATPITWVFQSEALLDPKITDFIKQTIDKYPNHSLGLNFHQEFALTSLSPQLRLQSIDASIQSFEKIFSSYPVFINACGLDAISLTHLRQQYSLMIGSSCNPYAFGAFIPSKFNALIPASSSANRLEFLLLPSTNYATNQINEFDYTSFVFDNLGKAVAVTETLNKLSDQIKVSTKFITPLELADYVLARYPESSPFWFRQFSNEQGNFETIYQNVNYSVRLVSNQKETILTSLISYPNKLYEASFSTPDPTSEPWLPQQVPLNTTPTIFTSSLAGIVPTVSNWQVSISDQNKSLTFLPDSISVSGGLMPIQPNNEMPYNFEGSFWLGFLILLSYFVLLLYRRQVYKAFSLLPLTLALLTVFTSGRHTPAGLGFFGPNGHDAIFHLSLIKHFSINPLSLVHPQIVGEMLQNYHFLFDYCLGIFAYLTKVEIFPLYFVYAPILIGISILQLIEQFLKFHQAPKFTLPFASIFLFLGGSLGFLINAGESAFWSNQSISIFLNPPLALSLLGLLAFYLSYILKKPLYLQVLIGALLAQTKVYSFVLLVLSLFVTRKFKLATLIAISGTLLLLPFIGSNAGSTFQFQPLWFIRTMFASPDRFNWPYLALTYQNFLQSGNLFKAGLISVFGVCVYLIGNISLRSVFILSKTKDNFIFSLIFLGMIIPLLLTQVANPWNTIQFTYYSIFFAGLLASLYLGKLVNSKIKFFVAVIFLTLSSITSYFTLRDYLPIIPSSRISYTEMYALKTLSNQPKGIVLSGPFEERLTASLAWPKPLYAYVSSAYISALTGHREFLSDQVNLDITSIDYQDKLKSAWRFYNSLDDQWQAEFLRKYSINYVYETASLSLKNYPKSCLTPLFESPEITISRVTCL